VPEQQLRQKMPIEMSSKSPAIDLFASSLHVEKLLFAAAGWYEPLNKYLENPNLTPPDYNWKDFGPAGTYWVVKSDGVVIGLPMGVGLFAYIYRRDLYAQKGLKPATTMDELAQVLLRDGYSSEAERLLTSSVAILATALGTKHSAYAGTLGHLAYAIALRGALDSAETIYRRAVDIRMESNGPDQTITALTWGGLADVLARRRKFAEADSLYRAALEVIRRHTTDTHVDVRVIYSGLASMYDAWGKPDSAAVYRRLAAR